MSRDLSGVGQALWSCSADLLYADKSRRFFELLKDSGWPALMACAQILTDARPPAMATFGVPNQNSYCNTA